MSTENTNGHNFIWQYTSSFRYCRSFDLLYVVLWKRTTETQLEKAVRSYYPATVNSDFAITNLTPPPKQSQHLHAKRILKLTSFNICHIRLVGIHTSLSSTYYFVLRHCKLTNAFLMSCIYLNSLLQLHENAILTLSGCLFVKFGVILFVYTVLILRQ